MGILGLGGKASSLTNIEQDVEMKVVSCNPPPDHQTRETGELRDEDASDIDMRSHQRRRKRCT